MKSASFLGGCGYALSSPSSSSSSLKSGIITAKSCKKHRTSSPKELQKRKSGMSRSSTSYCRKRVDKEELPVDIELYRDPTTTLY